MALFRSVVNNLRELLEVLPLPFVFVWVVCVILGPVPALTTVLVVVLLILLSVIGGILEYLRTWNSIGWLIGILRAVYLVLGMGFVVLQFVLVWLIVVFIYAVAQQVHTVYPSIFGW